VRRLRADIEHQLDAYFDHEDGDRLVTARIEQTAVDELVRLRQIEVKYRKLRTYRDARPKRTITEE
jgi:hypothetical protein